MVSNGWKTMFGSLLAATLLAGCFVPVIYGVYKVMDTGDRQVIAIRMTEQPEVVYKTAVAAVEERGGKIEKRDDKEFFLSGKSKAGLDSTLKVSALPEGGSEMTITMAKGKDPKAEREEIVNTVLSVCSKTGIRCTEETGKK